MTMRTDVAAAAGLLVATVIASGTLASAQSTVTVASVDELYQQVNDPGNAGKQIVLLPGMTYRLDPSKPNGGRLELQENMSLTGQVGDPTAVVIDASDLTANAATGVVRLGRGSNAVEWVTLQNDPSGTALIETDLPPTAAPTVIRVAHTILQRGARGIDLRATGSALSNRTMEAHLEDNLIQDNVRGQGQGLRVLVGATGNPTKVTIRATLIGNTFTGNQVGLLAASQTESNVIEISSSGDQFSDNRAGCWLMGGILLSAKKNVLRFTARGDQFTRNDAPKVTATSPYTRSGGIVGMGGAGRGSENRARVEAFDSAFDGSGDADISLFGYFDETSLGTPAGGYNTLEYRLAGNSPALHLATGVSVPEEASQPPTNAVVVLPPLLTSVGPVKVWVGLKNSDDVGTMFDLLAEVYRNGTLVGSGQLNDVVGGSSGFNNARLDVIPVTLNAVPELGTGDSLSVTVSVRIAATSGHRSGTARLWFDDAAADSRMATTIGGESGTRYMKTGFLLGTAPGSVKRTIDVAVDRTRNGNAFKPFGSWSVVF